MSPRNYGTYLIFSFENELEVRKALNEHCFRGFLWMYGMSVAVSD